MKATTQAIRKPAWVNIIFFFITTAVCLIGAPLYLMRYGIAVPEIALFAFYMVATGLSITVGYHRHFSHASFKTHPVIQFLLLFFGAAAFEQTAYTWSSQHRDHHQFVDTDQDPYSIKKGFWYAHIGWLLFWEHPIHYENAKDLAKNKMVMHQHQHYLLWAAGAGIVLPVLIGALTGHALGAFIFAVCSRITIVYHATFFINSICHMFGKPTYDIYSTAKDNWLIALLTYGEGYHNFHHRFPSDYRNAVRWYQWDPSKWTIALLAKLGLASKLCRVSDFSILSARLAAENKTVCDNLVSRNLPRLEKTLEVMKFQYETVRGRLSAWEQAVREYRALVKDQVTNRSTELKAAAAQKMQVAHNRFKQAEQVWLRLVESKPMDLQALLLT